MLVDSLVVVAAAAVVIVELLLLLLQPRRRHGHENGPVDVDVAVEGVCVGLGRRPLGQLRQVHHLA